MRYGLCLSADISEGASWAFVESCTPQAPYQGEAEKIEGYYDLIKGLDSERMVGYVLSHSYNNPSAAYNDPKVDWFGCNIYVRWYIDKTKNDPSSQLNTRIVNTTTRLGKPVAFSEYGCGGTQHCHSEDFMSTTTRGNYARHDIEYQMWLHEGHIAAIRNYPQLLFTSQWQLFDIAVSSRNEGYTECLDGENATTNDGDTLSLFVGDSETPRETVSVVNHIAEFPAMDFPPGVEIRVVGATTSDTVTFR